MEAKSPALSKPYVPPALGVLYVIGFRFRPPNSPPLIFAKEFAACRAFVSSETRQ
jgi:hypothetical protein